MSLRWSVSRTGTRPVSLILDTATGARRPERGAARVSAPLLSEAGLVVEIALLRGASGGISVTSCAVGLRSG